MVVGLVSGDLYRFLQVCLLVTFTSCFECCAIAAYWVMVMILSLLVISSSTLLLCISIILFKSQSSLEAHEQDYVSSQIYIFFRIRSQFRKKGRKRTLIASFGWITICQSKQTVLFFFKCMTYIVRLLYQR